jgi:transglutaminase-like putative cysteine protease
MACHNSRPSSTVLASLFLFLLCGLHAQQNPVPTESKPPKTVVSRKPPEAYLKHVAPLLTPLKEVMARRGDFPNPDRDGIILLDESIIHCDEKGSRIVVYHVVEEAQAESAIEALAESVNSYRTEDQKIYLVQARTIMADGSEIAVEDQGVIMESAQTEAGSSLYGDRGQMRIIFSGVRPGVVREVIVVTEEHAPRIPDQFSAQELWSAYWPTRQSRFVVHLPDSLASRVRETRLGQGVPDTEKKTLPGGWQLWTWSKERQAPVLSEGARAPTDQTGPALFLTTLPDWDVFGTWYRKLLAERSTLPKVLSDLAVEWTKEAKTEQEKIEAVITHVARDVRYTGLEFGLGALQPRAPDQVWQTSYGDCKDKSNLSALLLRSLGIQAYLTLIQTEHAGRIERRSPDTRHFNHAIVAVKSGTAWQFSDPTIRYGRPGMLAPSSSDRDALIVTKDGIEWAHTPPTQDGTLHYQVDAACDADGTMEGWLEFRCDGYYLAAERAYYERFNRIELKREVQESLEGLLPGARLIDAEPGNGPCIWRGFFSLSGQISGNDTRSQLRFPAGDLVSLSMSRDEKRETTRFLWPMTWRVTGNVKLPPGWTVAENPAPFDLHTDLYQVRGRWVLKDDVCMPDYEAKITSSLLTPAAHPAVWRGAQLLKSWLEKPLWLQRGAATSPPPAETHTLTAFPLMPSGEGQLALVEKRYPENGDPILRRAALRKTIDYFPADPETVFMASARLAMLDWDQNKPDAAIQSLRDLLAHVSPKVDAETVAWGIYMLSLVLDDQKKYAEAIHELEPVSIQEGLSAYRRSWLLYQLSCSKNGAGDKEGALKAVHDARALQLPEAEARILTQTAHVLFDLNRGGELAADIQTLLSTPDEHHAQALTQLANLAYDWSNKGHAKWTQQMLGMLETVKLSPPDNAYADALKRAQDTIAAAAAGESLQEELNTYLKAHADLDLLEAPKDGWPATQADCAREYAKADKVVDSKIASRLALHYITGYPTNGELGQYLWHTAAHLDAHERNQKIDPPSPLLLTLFALGRKLSKSDENHFEMRFLEGRMQTNRLADWKKAAATYAEMVADEKMPESFLVSAITRTADCHQRLGEWDKVIEYLGKLDKLISYGSAGDGLARAAQLHLEKGNPKEAARLLAVVETSRDFSLKNSQMTDSLRELLDLAKDSVGVLKQWQLKPDWWSSWEELRKLTGIEEVEIEPLLVDLSEAGGVLQQAIEARDSARAGPVLRQLVHCARWQPSCANNVAWMILYRLETLYPKQRQEMLRFAAGLLEHTAPIGEENTRARLMYLSICLMDSEQVEAAYAHIREYFKAFPKDTNDVSFVMARLWGVAAGQLKEGQAEAAALLEATLQHDEQKSDRARSVSILADLYHDLKKGALIKPLIERELKHPAIASQPDDLASLKRLLANVGAGSALQEAVKRWLGKHSPPWYQHAEPKVLNDEMMEALEAKENSLSHIEMIKLRFLAAAEAERSPNELLLWWNYALGDYLRLQTMQREEFDRLVLDVLEDAEAPADIKDATLRIACAALMDLDMMADDHNLRSKVPEKDISDFSRSYLKVFDAVRSFDGESAKSISEVLEARRKEKDFGMLGYQVSLMLRRMLNAGNIAAADRIAAALAAMPKPAGNQASTFQQIRLEAVKTLAAAKRLQPVHAALSKVVVAHHQKELSGAAQPPRYLGAVTSERIGSAHYLLWTAQTVSMDVFDHDDLGIWFDYVEACSEADTAGTWPLRRSIIQAAIAAATDDETRNLVCMLAASAADLDNPDERRVLLDLLKPWRDANALPRTYAQIRTLEARIAVRTGQPVDILALLEQVRSSGVEPRLHRLQLVQAMQSRNAPAVSTALDRLGGDDMLQPYNLLEVIPALGLCKRDAELELAREAGQHAITESVTTSWTGGSTGDAGLALSLAQLLNQPELLPPDWLKFIRQASTERHDQLVHGMLLASMKKDWPAVLAAAEEAVTNYSSFYSNYWYKAQALHELGRDAEAVEPLKVYIRYCNDEAWHYEAKELLKKISP